MGFETPPAPTSEQNKANQEKRESLSRSIGLQQRQIMELIQKQKMAEQYLEGLNSGTDASTIAEARQAIEKVKGEIESAQLEMKMLEDQLKYAL